MIETLVLCLVTAGAGVGYVWQKEQIDSLSRQLDERGVRLLRLTDENENRRRLLIDVRSLTSLELRIKELNLGLAPAGLTQIWHLAEPPREAPRPAARETPRPAPRGAPRPLLGEPQYANQNTRPAAAARAKELMSP
ncbi:MAG TPA: hypothetical protein VN829_11095 [Dongiaceae bacterium]|nr:hypothetical protein [Dongiaceae bacterium]